MIKYSYALDDRGRLVNVNSLDRETVNNTQKFYSLDTNEELIAKLGNIRQKHFSLKAHVSSPGSTETYLHALGKKAFLDEYMRCAQSKIGYKISYEQSYKCSRLEDKFGKTCKFSKQHTFDLTSYFTKIDVEKDLDSFRPDITLRNPQTNQVIFVEIAVTHPCSKEKISSNNRIIEFLIQEEADIAAIYQFGRGGTKDLHRVNLYNFNFNTKTITCKQNSCIDDFYFFKVRTDGSSHLEVCNENKISVILNSPKQIAYSISRPTFHNNLSGSHLATIFKHFVRRAYIEKSGIRNCFLCRYHADNTFNETVINPIFCKYHKIKCNSNQASKCTIYKPDDKYISFKKK